MSIRTNAGRKFFDHSNGLAAVFRLADHFKIVFKLQ